MSIERCIIQAAIHGLLEAGYYVSVHDGEETAVNKSRNADTIFGETGATDEDYLIAYTRENEKWQRVGMVWLVHGNGYDVVCDYSVALESALSAANATAAFFEFQARGEA